MSAASAGGYIWAYVGGGKAHAVHPTQWSGPGRVMMGLCSVGGGPAIVAGADRPRCKNCVDLASRRPMRLADAGGAVPVALPVPVSVPAERAPEEPGYVYRAEVRRVVDGDTVDLDVDLGFGVWRMAERVRLMGVDAPERWTPAGAEISAVSRPRPH